MDDKIDKRINPKSLKHGKYASRLHFIKNNNFRNIPNNLHGMLFYAEGHIYVALSIVSDQEDRNLVYGVPILPEKRCTVELINLRTKTAFYVQQVSGEPILKRRQYGTQPEHVDIPLLSENGHIKSSIHGPDRVVIPTKFKRLPLPPLPNPTVRATMPLPRSPLPNPTVRAEIPTPRSGTKQKEAIPKMVQAVYVLDNEEKRLKHEVSSKHYRFSIGDEKVGEDNRYSYKDFVDITDKSLSKILASAKKNKGGLTKVQYELLLDLHSEGGRKTVIVPKYDQQLRIKIVSQQEFDGLSKKEGSVQVSGGDGDCYIFRNETYDLPSTPGILVSTWTRSSLVLETSLNYDFAKNLSDVFGVKGTAKRKRTDNKGFQEFRRQRFSKRPHPTPLCDQNEIHLHEYYSTKYSLDLLRGPLEKKIGALTRGALKLQRILNRPLHELLGEACEMSIATMGMRPTSRTTWPVFSFLNNCHLDNCDEITKKLIGLLKLRTPRKHQYSHRLLDFVGFCVPTTCAYQFLLEDNAKGSYSTVEHYFALNGLGLAVPLEHGVGHTFMAAAFSHQTCACIVIDENDTDCEVRLLNVEDEFVVFAWGRSGGPAEAQARIGNS